MIVRLTSRPYPLSPISLLPISPLYIPFLFIYTSNFLTRPYHFHFVLIPFLSMFSSHSRLSSHLLPRFGHCFPLPTRTQYLFYTCTVTYLYALRHPFVRTSLVVCTDIFSCLYVPSRVEVRSFSINPLKYSYKLFKGFV